MLTQISKKRYVVALWERLLRVMEMHVKALFLTLKSKVMNRKMYKTVSTRRTSVYTVKAHKPFKSTSLLLAQSLTSLYIGKLDWAQQELVSAPDGLCWSWSSQSHFSTSIHCFSCKARTFGNYYHFFLIAWWLGCSRSVSGGQSWPASTFQASVSILRSLGTGGWCNQNFIFPCTHPPNNPTFKAQ